MDHKTWLWRKKSSEKTVVANSEEARSDTNEKEVELENSLRILNEKLAAVVDECSAKDEVVQSYKKAAEDALADKVKAEEEKRLLKEEFDEAQQQKMAANERLGHLNTALKDCMDQLNTVRQEQDQRVRDAVTKTSKELEKSHRKLEEKLSETSKGLASLTTENSYLSKALLVKEKLYEDLKAEFEALMTRLDSVEKENAFLRYEFVTLEKELDLRHEEMEYNRRSLEASRKQHLENVKKIKKLEADCQRLRGLTRNRLPGPVVSSNIQRDTRRKGNSVVKESFLIDQVQDLLKENKILEECLAKKEEEIFYLRKVKNFDGSDELSLTSGYGVGDSNEITSSCSRAIVLVSGQEGDKPNGPETEPESKMIGSEMSLMDDFVEMEKLAIVAVDSKDPSLEKPDDWLEAVKRTILDQHNVSKRSINELLGDLRTSLNSTVDSEASKLLPISGYLTWKSPTSSPNATLIQDPRDEMEPDVNASISRLIELVGRFDSNMQDEELSYKIHVFGWKKSELTRALQEFVRTCNNLLDGEINHEKFTGYLVYILGWIIEKSVSSQVHSSVRDKFRKHLGGDGPGTALELESVQNLMLEMEKMQSIFQVEIEGLKNELNLITSSDEESKRTTEDRMENLEVINEDLVSQLTVTKAKLSEVVQKLSSVEVELDNKSHYCEELEGTCFELQLQLESVASNGYSENNKNQEGLLQTGMEITKASVKLAQCEETIMKLGKQLKALGSTKDLSADNRNKKLKQRSSLRDRMLCEDNGETSNPEESPEKKEIISTTEENALVPANSCNAFSFPDGQVATPTPYRNENINAKTGALVIVPSKKRGGGIGLLRKLLLRRKKASSKSAISFYFGK